jgi:kynureninase
MTTAEPLSAAARDAALRDAGDALSPLREQFYTQPGQIYLDGNSLGLLSHPAESALLRALEEWKTRAIGGWTEGPEPWFWMAEELARLTAPLVGAEPKEVSVTGSTTVNLHQLLATLFRPEGTRAKLLVDALCFPSDGYAAESHLRLRGLDPKKHLVRVRSRDGLSLAEDRIIAGMDESVALAVLPSVVYTSGQLLDMERLTSAAHERGVLIGFDCSHSVGVIPHRLSEWGVDFAFWCGYKYLNGGPGATAGLYLNRRHWGLPGLAGWWGCDKQRQFEMSAEFHPAAGAGALQIGTPHILSMAPLRGSLQMIAEAGPERIRTKSLALTGMLLDLAEELLTPYGFAIGTPREAERRGGHVALLHPEASRICRALRAEGVVPDFRPPNIVRLAPVPLYTSFSECVEAVRRLVHVMETGSYRSQAPQREVIP